MVSPPSLDLVGSDSEGAVGHLERRGGLGRAPRQLAHALEDGPSVMASDSLGHPLLETEEEGALRSERGFTERRHQGAKGLGGDL
eukprot:10762122-Alexandrium_andersonii.AAC.1